MAQSRSPASARSIQSSTQLVGADLATQEANNLADQVDGLASSASIEAARLDGGLQEQFEEALGERLDEKREQVSRIEDRLESLLTRQAGQLQALSQSKPWMPSARRQWQASVDRQRQAVQRLQDRLEHVREIRDGLTPHGTKLEALAMGKLRFEMPNLVMDWEEMREAARRHQALMRLQEQERRRRERAGEIDGNGESLRVSLARGLKLARD
ncbi:hypothetical protein LMG7143_04468 [Ralstonia thomasii]|jgi:hypothetical protein|uniref:IncP plasmid survival protein KfrC family protein n=1 Tax=Ralstonia TaxID=48736 RepID=UPI0011AF59AE|nr:MULTISPECIES: IncP plasmid survival protein KfrC family protein [Ralstonia]MBT2180874.1 conjugal transfer protein [Ralstonia pickettii]CAJ0718622.1 hypothetical protein LMG7143_04468 [Ralstonia sp. LMG 18095]